MAIPAHIRLPKNERREQLLEVAVDLFSQKGFNGTTTREIAAAAGVTEAIIFRHFETKEHLYSAILDQKLNSAALAEWLSGLKSAMDRDDDEAVVRQLISAIIETHRTDPKFERLMQYAALEGYQLALLYMRRVGASFVELFKSYVLRRQKQGHWHPVDPDAALIAIVGMAKFYALNKYVHCVKEHGVSDAQAVESFTRIAMNGLCVPRQSKTSKVKRKV